MTEALRFRYSLTRAQLAKGREAVYRWISVRLPRELVMWCCLRVAAHATTGKYSKTVVPELTMMDAVKRWDDDRGR